MKIINYKKKNNNLYEIKLDNKEIILLYDDIILKYNLLITNEINKEQLKDIIKDNNKVEAYYIAIKYLKIKLRTKKEIRKKLSKYDLSIVNYVINRLYKEGYLNDLYYITSYINDKINLELMGQNKIISNLKRLGFKEEDILNYLNTIDKDIWFQKINKYIIKKIKLNHNLSGIVLKNNIIRELLFKGFNSNDINNEIDKFEFIDDKNIYNHEYEKIKKRLIKKYQDKELETQIKITLYKKGFRI